MTINISLSAERIRSAINRLNTAQDHLRWGVQDLVELLAQDGADVANAAYGDMDAHANGYSTDENVGVLAVTGETNLIAEFGAGDATIPGYGFENEPETPVYPGSYSELEGSGEYASTLEENGSTGYWHFGGQVYHEVEPRMGLVKAKAFIIATADETAKEVIKL